MMDDRETLDNTMPSGCTLDALKWRDLFEFPGYAVSEYGHVKRTLPGKKTWPGKILKPKWSHFGYPYYGLTLGGKKVHREAHRLVATAFIGDRPFEGAQVAHGDGDYLNNHYSNLRYATPLENSADRELHGTDGRGERNSRSKLTADDVREIRRLKATHSLSQIAAIYGVAFQTISKIATRKSWGHVDG